MRNSFRAGPAGTAVAGLRVTAGTAGAAPPGPGVTGTIIAQETAGAQDGVYEQGSPITEPSDFQ